MPWGGKGRRWGAGDWGTAGDWSGRSVAWPVLQNASMMKQGLGSILVLAVLGFAIYALIKQVRGLDPAEVLLALRSLQPLALVVAAGFLGACYVAYAGMERLSAAHAGKSLTIPQAVGLAVVAQGISLTTGKGVLVAGAVRLRILGRWGCDVAQTILITFLVSLHGNAGLAFLIAIVCLLFGPWAWAWWVGLLVLGGVGLWLVICAYAQPFLIPEKFTGGRSITPPNLPDALRGIALGVGEKLACAMLAWELLPGDPGIALGTFLAVILVALAVARFSQVPGGLGVLEVTVIGLWPVPIDPYKAQLLAGLLAFRLAYYIVPLLVALPLLAFLGWWRKGTPCATESV